MNRKINIIKLLLMSISLVCISCGKEENRDSILKRAISHDSAIKASSDRGIERCKEDLASAGIELREEDHWSPTSFNEHEYLSDRIGVRVRYISFYSTNGEFVGILMMISPNLILYRGNEIGGEITIAGSRFIKQESRGEFSFFTRK